MHNVEVRMDGYEDWKESVDIIPNKEIKLTPTLQMKFGSVSIDSNPLNSMILMDGKESWLYSKFYIRSSSWTTQGKGRQRRLFRLGKGH